ncbi:MAG: hypothetical protein AMJ81_00180 [Phycisphaerae bacterium SM23_33]|nr:MAG: hypothetical protein AMJ81_00180 [Phycisphaerae bacterium SM23_33]
MNRWKRKVRALARLADDQRGKPEGDVARQKLLQIINKYPEAASYEPVVELAKKDLTMADVGWMKRHGVSLAGGWTGGNLYEAIALMEADYRERLARAKRKRLAAPVCALEGKCS